MYHLSEAYLMSVVICCLSALLGALVFGAGSVAPTAVRLLDQQNCALFLRAYWPTYHRLATNSGLIMTAIMGVGSVFSAIPLLYVTIILALSSAMTLCFWGGLQIIPAINRARDDGDEKRFDRLHKFDLCLVGIGLLLLLSVITGLVYVLPGQFTFWPTAPTAH